MTKQEHAADTFLAEFDTAELAIVILTALTGVSPPPAASFEQCLAAIDADLAARATHAAAMAMVYFRSRIEAAGMVS